jgi:hypothetical protein
MSQTGLRVTNPLTFVPPDQRDVIAEAPAVELDKATPVAGFFNAHGVEYSGGRGEILAQTLGVIGVGAFVVFFERDAKG